VSGETGLGNARTAYEMLKYAGLLLVYANDAAMFTCLCSETPERRRTLALGACYYIQQSGLVERTSSFLGDGEPEFDELGEIETLLVDRDDMDIVLSLAKSLVCDLRSTGMDTTADFAAAAENGDIAAILQLAASHSLVDDPEIRSAIVEAMGVGMRWDEAFLRYPGVISATADQINERTVWLKHEPGPDQWWHTDISSVEALEARRMEFEQEEALLDSTPV